MDQYYDRDEARVLLETIAKYRMEKGDSSLQLALLCQDEALQEQCTSIPINRPKNWKLAKMDGEGMPTVEIVLRLQGIVCDKELPPIKKGTRIEPKRRRFIRQSITLTGCGANSFESCVESIQAIHEILKRSHGENVVEDWGPGVYQIYSAIDMGNRYFTDRHDKGEHESIDFGNGVDPNGVLERSMEGDFVHLEENEVKYYEITRTGDEIPRYKKIEPIKVQTGDIVEAQVSFSTVPLKGDRFKMLLVLRSIAILDTTLLRKAHILKMKTKLLLQYPPVKTRRLVGYDEDDELETVENVSHMEIK